MKILFLDINGVLSSGAWRNSQRAAGLDETLFKPDCLAALRWLLEKNPDLRIVVTSTWRTRGPDYVRDVFERNGIGLGRILGATPCHPGLDRVAEIRSWLLWHGSRGQEYVVLDDKEVDNPFLIRVDHDEGLTMEAAQHVLRLLRCGPFST